jgi:hypothetical protein
LVVSDWSGRGIVSVVVGSHPLTGMTVTELRHHRDLAGLSHKIQNVCSPVAICFNLADHKSPFAESTSNQVEAVAKMKIVVGALAALTGVAAFAPRSLRYGQHRHESKETSWSRYPKRAGPALAAGVSEIEPLHRANERLDNPCLKCLTLN